MTKVYQCLVRIKDGLFLTSRHVKPNQTKYVFGKPIESFEIYSPNDSKLPSYWAITGPQKTPFLKIAAGHYISTPPLARTFPYFAEHNFNYNDKIQFLNFSESSGLDKVHLSARYESFSYKGELEMSDDVNSVQNYITGANNYNSNTAVDVNKEKSAEYVAHLLKFFDLEHLKDKWINSLSNGQLRRARIAKSLINKPSLLIIDDPFLGLDPEATVRVSNSISKVVQQFGIGVVLGLRVQDNLPKWISHVGYVDSDGLEIAAERDSDAVKYIHKTEEAVSDRNKESKPITNEQLKETGAPHIEFNNASVVYKSVPVLQNFNWAVPRGSKWRILGNNGTGKTTILSLITADHPQSWKSVLAIDGNVRKTGSGSSFFDINNRIGISSPELHALVPGNKTMMQIIMTGLTNDVGNSNFMFVAKSDKLTPFAVDLLSKFSDRLDKYGDTPFHDLLISDQKLALFLRASVKNPEILILDEAFSCMDDVEVMHRCHALVSSWKDMTVLSIGHIDWELPTCEYVIKLRGNGKPYDIEQYV